MRGSSSLHFNSGTFLHIKREVFIAISLRTDVLIRGEWRLQGVRARASRVTTLVGSDHNTTVFVIFAFGFFECAAVSPVGSGGGGLGTAVGR